MSSGPIMLVVLDGFGLGEGGADDATQVAHTPFFDHARADLPMAQVETSGEAVGLPPGQMGNSEVGHMTLGAGRIIDQDMTRIGKALAAGEAARNPALVQAFDAVANGGTLHLMGLVSDGGVHSHQEHLYALLREAKARGVETMVHAFLDGRDTPPQSGRCYMEQLLEVTAETGARVATVSGRYYAMDRDNRWDRIQRAYDALVLGEGATAPDALAAIDASYERGEHDEFVVPTVVDGGAPIQDGDAVVFFNFRADRARQITAALASQKVESFEGELERRRVPKLAAFVCFTEYDSTFELEAAFPPQSHARILGELVADAGLKQLRIAETEKYAHVTFFFNCGAEEPFAGEERVLIPSPRDVPTYDHKPEMSAQPVTETLLGHLRDGDYRFVLVNFANPDMVGHTGVLPAAIKAVETIDSCLARVTDGVLALGGSVLITADHGNCEQMIDPETGGPHTAHTTNPVPIWWVTRDAGGRTLRNGGLADVAPTVLELLGIDAPAEMTGHSLLVSVD